MIFPSFRCSIKSLLIDIIIFVIDFKIDEGGLSAGALAGIIISSCAVLIILVVVFLWMKGYICKKEVPANGKVV